MTWPDFMQALRSGKPSDCAALVQSLTDFGTPQEIIRALWLLKDTPACALLARRALTAGVRFSAQESQGVIAAAGDALAAPCVDALQDFSSTEDLASLAWHVNDPAACARLVRRALDKGHRFSAEQSMRILWAGGDAVADMLVTTLQDFPDTEQFIRLSNAVDKSDARALLVRRALEKGYRFSARQTEELLYGAEDELSLPLTEALQDYTSAEDIASLACCLTDDAALSLLIRRALDKGLRFTAKQTGDLLDVADDAIASTLVGALEDFSDKKIIVDMATCSCNEHTADLLIRRALGKGVRFSAQQIRDMECALSDFAYQQLLASGGEGMRLAQMALDYHTEHPDDAYPPIYDPDSDSFMSPEDYRQKKQPAPVKPVRVRKKKPSLLFRLARFALELLPAFLPAPHKRYCNGDCANCPPHYGYRYGRWYYGHGHTRGCTMGGSGGDRRT